MPFRGGERNALISRNIQIRNGHYLTEERIVPRILDDQRLLPKNHVPAERMRQQRFASIRPRLRQALLALEELAVCIDQRNERNRNVKHAADKLG